jgi:hypothetical protein
LIFRIQQDRRWPGRGGEQTIESLWCPREGKRKDCTVPRNKRISAGRRGTVNNQPLVRPGEPRGEFSPWKGFYSHDISSPQKHSKLNTIICMLCHSSLSAIFFGVFWEKYTSRNKDPTWEICATI